jgi:hypothetical protein
MIWPHLHGIAVWDFLKKERELIRGNPGRFLKHRPALPQHICFSFFGGVSASKDTIERGRRSLLSIGKSRPHRHGRKTTRTKFFGTLIKVVWIRVISSGILAFVTIETVSS